MATYSANDIIEAAMVKATIIYPGESVPASKSTQVFNDLNNMLESWSLERLMVYAGYLENFALVAGQSEYTYGTGGDFDSDRPVKLDNETYVRSGGLDHYVALKPLDIYRRLAGKEELGIPRFLSFNPEFPLFKVFLYPTPSAADQIYFNAVKQLVSFPDKTTSVVLPPGYSRAIILNLAIEICPGFNKVASAELLGLATSAVASIRKVNVRPVKSLRTDHLTVMAGGGRVNRNPLNCGPWGS